MRWVFHILILTIFISGYAAAAHAFAPVSGDQGQAQMMDTGCAGCQHDKADDSDTDQENSGNACMNCQHCCAGHHIGFPSSVSINLFPSSKIISTIYVEDVTGDHTFSLLRPPRILV